MKQFQIAGKLLKSLLLAGLLSACNHDDSITPTEVAGIDVQNQNAKLSLAFKLVKYGNENVFYVKTGKFIGMVEKVEDIASYKLYTYDDSSGSNKLVIKCTTYSKSTNQQIGEMTFEVVNGRCTTAYAANGLVYEYKYNGTGLLEEEKLTYQGQVFNRLFTYKFNAATNTQRLQKITTIDKSGPTNEVTFGYSAISDKSSLNPEYCNLDQLLPIFGKFSDVLASSYVTNTLTPGQPLPYNKLSYLLDNNGYVSSRTLQHYPLGQGSNSPVDIYNKTFTFSQNWL